MANANDVINGVPFINPVTKKVVEIDGLTIKDAIYLKNIEKIAEAIRRLK